MAEKDTAGFQPSEGSSSINKVKQRTQQTKSERKFVQTSAGRKDLGRSKIVCTRCGQNHSADTCKFKKAKCYKCGCIGHIAKKCRNTKSASYVQDNRYTSEDNGDLHGIDSCSSSSKTSKVMVHPTVGSVKIPMELDTGCSVSVIGETTYNQHFKHSKLLHSGIKLKSYSGNDIEVLGKLNVTVNYEGQERRLPLLVVKGDKPSLFGRNWLNNIKLKWDKIFQVESLSLEGLKEEYAHLWQEADSSTGPIKGFKASIKLKDDAKPIFCKARTVPYAVKDAVEKEFRKLEANGIVYKVSHSDWATPLVVVPKPDGKSVRICADYKVTVNRVISEEQYPIPSTDDLFASLAGGQQFTKLDLSQAYLQLCLDKDSEEYLTVNTHMGLYRFRRLTYGCSSAPAIFQSVMDTILAGMPNVVCRIDDILITAPSKEQHLQTLKEVLNRLDNHNIKLKKEKCVFMADKVVYMGHIVDSEGIHPTSEKVQAIRDAPVPRDVSQLKSYLGLLNYYGNFLPNLSTLLQPLHELLRKDKRWVWTDDCQIAFDKSKSLITDSGLLVHFDARKPLRLACDASSFGVGAVLSHVENDTEKPIAFASRTLSSSERNYSALQRECLAIVFGVKKFHKYLYGKKFELVTDSKPLTAILGPKKGIPSIAAARKKPWTVTHSAYNFDATYRKEEDNANSDFLARLPLQISDEYNYEKEN